MDRGAGLRSNMLDLSPALIVRKGEIAGVEAVSARGREGPLWHSVEAAHGLRVEKQTR